jgi:hypothetical protein
MVSCIQKIGDKMSNGKFNVVYTTFSAHDVLVFEEDGLVPAVTMMSNPHTAIGNTGRHTDVHSSIACNVPGIQQLNAGFNDKMLVLGTHCQHSASSDYRVPEMMAIERPQGAIVPNGPAI